MWLRGKKRRRRMVVVFQVETWYGRRNRSRMRRMRVGNFVRFMEFISSSNSEVRWRRSKWSSRRGSRRMARRMRVGRTVRRENRRRVVVVVVRGVVIARVAMIGRSGVVGE
jgi:hypothetical protein